MKLFIFAAMAVVAVIGTPTFGAVVHRAMPPITVVAPTVTMAPVHPVAVAVAPIDRVISSHSDVALAIPPVVVVKPLVCINLVVKPALPVSTPR